MTFEEVVKADRFYYGVELVTSRGMVDTANPNKQLQLGEAFSANPRVSWISITDNPSGNAMLPPDALARLLAKKKEVLIHLTCKDINRNSLESSAWGYASEGFRNILALSGDYPQVAFRGTGTPVFDFDSVNLIYLLHSMNQGLQVPGRKKGETETLPQTRFYIGCAVSPFKRLESELMGQYFKLVRKAAAGAQFVIPQLGYDMRKFHEVKLFRDRFKLGMRLVGNVYVLTKGVAELFHRNLFPGCVVTDELLELCRKYGAGPDKGKQFFIELAAKQLAVFKGMGFDAGYLAGLNQPETFDQIVDLAESYSQNDWKAFAKEIQYNRKGEFYLFEQDPATGLGDPNRLNRAFVRSQQKPRRYGKINLFYAFNRLVHTMAFNRGKGLFNTCKFLYSKIDNHDSALYWLAHRFELVAKAMLFKCRDCGDCSLPDCAYICPMASCSKNERNGPCGGSNEGICENEDKTCIWVRIYDRLKRYGEFEKTVTGPMVTYDANLLGTSSWANTFLGRDHFDPEKQKNLLKRS